MTASHGPASLDRARRYRRNRSRPRPPVCFRPRPRPAGRRSPGRSRHRGRPACRPYRRTDGRSSARSCGRYRGHGPGARRNGLVVHDGGELHIARDRLTAAGHLGDDLIPQGGLDNPHRRLAGLRGQVVVHDLEPQTRFGSHAGHRVGMTGLDRDASGQDRLARRGRTRRAHGHAVIARLDRLIRRDRPVRHVVEDDFRVGIAERIKVYVDGRSVRRQVGQPDPANPEVAEDANAVAAAGMPSSRAEAASSMSNRLVSLGNI